MMRKRFCSKKVRACGARDFWPEYGNVTNASLSVVPRRVIETSALVFKVNVSMKLHSTTLLIRSCRFASKISDKTEIAC